MSSRLVRYDTSRCIGSERRQISTSTSPKPLYRFWWNSTFATTPEDYQTKQLLISIRRRGWSWQIPSLPQDDFFVLCLFSSWSLLHAHIRRIWRPVCHALLSHGVNCGRFCFFGVVSVCFLFVREISRESLNGFAPNPHGRRVWSLARTSLKVKAKGQGHRGQKRHFWPFQRPAYCVHGLCLVEHLQPIVLLLIQLLIQLHRFV